MLIASIVLAEVKKEPLLFVCSPPGVKKPPLMLPYDGKCVKGYRATKTKDEKTIMYCVNTEFPKPTECKQVKVPGKAQPR